MPLQLNILTQYTSLQEPNVHIIPHLNNSFLVQCDVTRSLNRLEQLFINQGRTTLYRLLRMLDNTGLMLYLHR